LILKLYSAK